MATLNTPGPDDDRAARSCPSTSRATPRPGHRARRLRTAPDAGPDTAPDTGPDDGPVLEGEVVRVDRPGPDRADWLADLAARTKDRRPIIHPALRSRREAARHRPVGGRAITGTCACITWSGCPKYGGKLAVRAPRGFTRTVVRADPVGL